VVAEGPLTLRISLDRPYMSFLEVLAMDGLKIVPRAAIERMGEAAFGRAPVGTGPFRLAAWDSGRLLLEANPEHFGGRPHLRGVDIGFYRPTETDAGASRFDRGEIDVLEVPAEALETLSVDPDIRIRRYQDLNLAFMGVSRKHPPFDDLRVRQAVASAVNRDRIVGASPLYRRGAIGILPPGMQAYSPEPKALPFDRDKARRLLAEAGHPGGRGLPVVPLYCGASRASIGATAEMIRADLAAVGITVEVRQVPWRELSRLVDDQEAPLFLLNWLADLSDPDSFLRSLFESGGTSNYFAYRDEETEKLLAEGASETNPVLRARIYRRIEHRILQQAPLVPLYHPVNHLAVRADVLDFTPGPLGISSVNFGRVRIARARRM
jgi:ABC-type transport system substrate-binding protein